MSLAVAWLYSVNKNGECRHEKKTAPSRLDQFILALIGFVTATPKYTLGNSATIFLKLCEVLASNDRGNLLMGISTPMIPISY
jgi:hypothetical protein